MIMNQSNYTPLNRIEQDTMLLDHQFCLNRHPTTLDYLKANPSKIRWGQLSNNDAEWVRELVQDHTDKLCYDSLCHNKSEWAGELIRSRIKWDSALGKALDPEMIEWYLLSYNEAEWAGELLKAHPGRIYPKLSKNESTWVGELLKANPDMIDWDLLCKNKSEWAGELLKANPDKIYWKGLDKNGSKWAAKMRMDKLDNII